jgi:DNA ligase (NAD+)
MDHRQLANLAILLPLALLAWDLGPVQGGANRAVGEDTEIQRIVDQLKKYNKAYRKGEPLIPDHEYDALIEQLRMVDPKNAYLKKVEPQIVRGKKVFHNPPMLSTKKSYTHAKLRKFLEDMVKASKKIGIDEPTLVITPKLDGIAIDWSDDVLSTRGTGEFGNNITRLVGEGVRFIPDYMWGEEFRGELVVPRRYFNEHLADKNSLPRNFVAGLANSKTLDERKKKVLQDGAVHAVSFEGFNGDQKRTFQLSPENIEYIINNIELIHSELINAVPYDCDGIVLSITNPEVRKEIGRVGNSWGYQVAYKLRGEEQVTPVTKVDWSIGRSGTLTPVLSFDPVYFNKVEYADGTLSGGIVARRATAHNWRMYTQKGLGLGAKIVVLMSGEVIPYVSKIVEPNFDTPYPDVCPYCETGTVIDGPKLYCPNPTCRGVLMKRILLFTSELEIPGFGSKTILKLVDAGFNKVSDILDMTLKDYQKAGFGLKTARKLYHGIRNAFSKGIPKSSLIRAFGVARLGEGETKKLIDAYPDLEIIRLNEIQRQQLMALKGVGPKISDKIQGSLREMWPQIERIMSHEFAIVEPQRIVPQLQDAKTFAFTGDLDFGLKEIQRYTREQGHRVSTRVGTTVDYLVLGSRPGSHKLKLAKQQGVPTISESDFFAMVS